MVSCNLLKVVDSKHNKCATSWQFTPKLVVNVDVTKGYNHIRKWINPPLQLLFQWKFHHSRNPICRWRD